MKNTTLTPEQLNKLQMMRGKPPRLAKMRRPKEVAPLEVAALEQMVTEMIALQAVGESLKIARKQRRLTTRQLAAELGVSQSRVVHMEQANDNLEIQTVARVAKTLGYRVLLQLIPEDASEAAISVTVPQFEAIQKAV
jgi:ribosome-binding protein aMBF1 (putative translation factor)